MTGFFVGGELSLNLCIHRVDICVYRVYTNVSRETGDTQMTARFELQHCASAFSSYRAIPERLWKRASRHSSLAAALKALDKANAAMRRICGPSAWNGHFRLVALADTAMKAQSICCGPAGGAHSRKCEGQTTCEYVWPAGETKPAAPLAWTDCCPACRELEG